MVTMKIDKFNVTGYNKANMNFLVKEIFKKEDYYFECDKKNPLIIDVGANIGISTLYFKRLYPKCMIYSIEANPLASKMYIKNMQDNKIHSWIHYNNAASNTYGTKISFYIDSKDSVVGSTNPDRGGKTKVETTTIKLSNLITKDDIVDLLKMDIEGSEWDVLKDLVRTDKLKNIKQAFIEYHHGINNKPHMFGKFLNEFEDSGFKYNLMSDWIEDDGFQDIFIHFWR